MQYTVFDFLKLIGSLGLFLYGMKIMSESLQALAGSKMRSILSSMTSNRVFGVLVGFLVTSVIQSSSATTVMVVSFVNAGLISLTESIGVIMGANIGTTITGWLISILGFKVKISGLILPIVGISLPLIFSKHIKRKSLGEFLIGFALLFLGLEFLKDSVPSIDQNPEILSFLQHYTHLGFGSVLIFLAIGSILTIIIQSSSATMALTFVMCNNGWISFDLAAAMILGENIGTTITANLAATVGNISAKRAAFVHFLFNVFGVIWMLIVFYPFTSLVDQIITHHNGTSPSSNPEAIPIALSLFHTSFNILNTFVFIWFVPFLKKTVETIIKSKGNDEEEFRLRFITTGLLSTPELSLLQANKEAQLFGRHTAKMFSIVMKLADPNNKKFVKQFSKIQKYEDHSDQVEFQIAGYLTEIPTDKLSETGKSQHRAILKLVSDLESIADSCFNLARIINRMHENKIELAKHNREQLQLLFHLVEEALEVMCENLEKEPKQMSIARAKDIENRINIYRNQLKIEHLDNLKNGIYSPETGIYFNDLFSGCEKLADFVINVSEALDEVRK